MSALTDFGKSLLGGLGIRAPKVGPYKPPKAPSAADLGNLAAKGIKRAVRSAPAPAPTPALPSMPSRTLPDNTSKAPQVIESADGMRGLGGIGKPGGIPMTLVLAVGLIILKKVLK
jgi:hypothetical protein